MSFRVNDVSILKREAKYGWEIKTEVADFKLSFQKFGERYDPLRKYYF